MDQLRSPAPAAHFRGHLRFRRQCADRHVILRGQRTCRARLAFPGLARFVFWGYQLFIVLAATGYLLGITQGRNTPSRNGTSTCG
jgi:hypothetical protein